ncbi:unnamed protein product [Schistosoma margrebowiei]|uniref:Uncharacterized protein n=1 Tax=Schistosoma margrebowiei TaxID=48269 RepID=A0AA84ZMI0_9TREM|nr:unnamed protein product [Schistosoma margrebowiei]
MEESRNTKIFILVSLAIAICFTVVAIAEDKTLTAEHKSSSLKAFQAFYFLALIAFIVALVLYAVTIFIEPRKILSIGFFVAIVIGCICCIISVIVYYQNYSSSYVSVRPHSSSWLLGVILASFQLVMFVFMYILY